MKKRTLEKDIKERFGLFDFATGPGFEKLRKKSRNFTAYRTVADLNGGKDRIALYGKDNDGNIEMIFSARWQKHKVLDLSAIFD